jgi:hypothetical protein
MSYFYSIYRYVIILIQKKHLIYFYILVLFQIHAKTRPQFQRNLLFLDPMGMGKGGMAASVVAKGVLDSSPRSTTTYDTRKEQPIKITGTLIVTTPVLKAEMLEELKKRLAAARGCTVIKLSDVNSMQSLLQCDALVITINFTIFDCGHQIV